MRRNRGIKTGLTALVALVPGVASAHAFGQTYTLPVPLWLFIYGGAAAVIVSFLIIGLFMNKKPKGQGYSTIDLRGQLARYHWMIPTAKIVSILLFALTIVAGFIGSQESYANFNIPFFWIIFLLGLTYLIALIGNIWPVVNPIKIVVEWIEGLLGKEFQGVEPYPVKTLGYYPALLAYFLVIWVELFSEGFGVVPRNLSFLILTYTLIMIVCAYWYGKQAWFKYGEFFSVFFDLVGRVASVEYTNGKVKLRWPFVGLLKDRADHFSLVLFILFMLSSTGFDGLKETTAWGQFTTLLPTWLSNDPQLLRSLFLLISPFILWVVYWVFLWVMKLLIGSKKSVSDLALTFAFSLIPIAVVYNVAHYYTLLLIQGQTVIRPMSDPFGFGWNLFGTAAYQLNIGIIGAATVWYSQIALIIIGHMAAVYVAHIEALRFFPKPKDALISQYPMLLLMVLYTMVSLWIIAQPIAV